MDITTTTAPATTNVLSRRSLIKLAFAAACALPAQAALAACSSSEGASKTTASQAAEKDRKSAGTSAKEPPAAARDSAQAPAAADGGSQAGTPRALVAFFSGTGHTERVAQLAAE